MNQKWKIIASPTRLSTLIVAANGKSFGTEILPNFLQKFENRELITLNTIRENIAQKAGEFREIYGRDEQMTLAELALIPSLADVSEKRMPTLFQLLDADTSDSLRLKIDCISPKKTHHPASRKNSFIYCKVQIKQTNFFS